jgi:hypothetical protein
LRLHDRMVRRSFWNDPFLARQSRDLRFFFEGLWAVADDSGCVDDDMYGIKLLAFPAETDFTEERLNEWRDALLSARKLVRYESAGKTCLYIVNFHKHQTIKNQDAPEVLLPPWITWNPFPSNDRAGRFSISYDVLTEFLQSSSNPNRNPNLNRNSTPLPPHEGEPAAPATGRGSVKRPKATPDPRVGQVIGYYARLYERRFGERPLIQRGRDAKAVKDLLTKFEPPRLWDMIQCFLVTDDPFIRGSTYSLGVFVNQVHKMAQATKSGWPSYRDMMIRAPSTPEEMRRVMEAKPEDGAP